MRLYNLTNVFKPSNSIFFKRKFFVKFELPVLRIRIFFWICILDPDIFVQMFNNVSEGRVTRWHSNGEIYSDGQFINGNRKGEFNWYYDSGKRKERSFFDGGKRIAMTTQWYENGKKKSKTREFIL